jgi:hypothetical protein
MLRVRARRPHTALVRVEAQAICGGLVNNQLDCLLRCGHGTNKRAVIQIPPLVYVGTLPMKVKEEWLDRERKKQRREGVPLLDPCCGVHDMGPNILMGRAAVRRRHILPDAGAMEGDFPKHAVAVDRIESILEVQADNDEVGGILLVCHQAVEGMDEAFCTPSDSNPNLVWLQILTDSGQDGCNSYLGNQTAQSESHRNGPDTPIGLQERGDGSAGPVRSQGLGNVPS